MKPVDVIITLYVPTDETLRLAKRCILSVLLRTDHPCRVILVDDQSPKAEVRDFMRRVAGRFRHKNILMRFNESNLGFVKTANNALLLGQALGHDVVMLNNDTEVTTGWLGKMVRTAYSNERIATVSPFSNNATIVSFPRMHEDNPLPAGLTTEQIGRVVEERSPRMAPELPTGHGFCLFVKRSVLDEIGLLDAVSFGKGYGEENDLCCRCLEHGYVHVLEDATYVYHKGEASFQGKRKEVTGEHFDTLARRYPFFKEVITEFELSDPLARIRTAIGAGLRDGPHGSRFEPYRDRARYRVLFLNARGGRYNGLKTYTENFCRALGTSCDVFTLESDGAVLQLRDGVGLPLLRVVLPEKLIWNRVSTNVAYRKVLSYIVEALGVSIIQVNCFEGHTFDVVEIAASASVPIIYVTHDFELACPTHFFVSPEGASCDRCRYGEEKVGCLEQSSFVMSGKGTAPELRLFREAVATRVVPALHHVVFPSRHARTELLSYYPSLRDKSSVIPHGVNQLHATDAPAFPREEGRLRVATVGALHPLKGLELLKEIVHSVTSEAISFHHFGPAIESVPAVTMHGEYQAADLPRLLTAGRIDLVLLLSLLPETYGYTLSEVAQARVPVVAHAAGSYVERINELEIGWVTPYMDVVAITGLLDDLARTPARLAEVRKRMKLENLSPLEEMARQYLALYGRVGAVPIPSPCTSRFEMFARVAGLGQERERELLRSEVEELRLERMSLAAEVERLRAGYVDLAESIPIRMSQMIKRVPWVARPLKRAFRSFRRGADNGLH